MKKINWMPHQLAALAFTENNEHCAYYLDMGLGKTFIGAERLIRYGLRMNLVVCQKSKIHDWIEHFKTYYDEDVFDLTKPKQMKSFINYTGNKMAIGIINYELLWRRPELKILYDHFTMLLDESSIIQNRISNRTRGIIRRHPTHTILLSGTPTSGKYEDMYTQAKLLGWDIKYDTYMTHYVNRYPMKLMNRTILVVDKDNPYKNVERLKNKFRQHGAIFLKTEECIRLPMQNFQYITVPRSAKYKKFEKHRVVEVNGELLSGDTELTYRLHLRQLSGAYSKDKLEAYRDILESTNDRIIVFYCFTSELEALLSITGTRPVSIVNGSYKDLTAYENDDDSVTFVQYQAGAMGLNLQKANKIVYFSLPDGRSDLFDQSLKRIHRIGQSRPCYYYILLCDKSIDEDILNTLDIRIERTNELFKEDGDKEWLKKSDSNSESEDF